jgi:translocation and assembly module TamB
VGHSSSNERPFDQLALEGTLTTNRGTYRLNLGIAQPKFVVETGTVQFLGDPEFNALLNINAMNTVHRLSSANSSQQDIRIRVHIGGTLVKPQLALSSADSLLNISQTDLVSYLLTGAPSFNVTSQSATASLLRSLGSYLGDQLRGFGLFDVVDIELGRQAVSSAQGLTGSIFTGARLGVGRQLGDRTFISANTGLCQVGSLLGSGSSANLNLVESIGVKLDYRVNDNVGLSGGFEPSTNAVLCTSGLTQTRRFAPTPPQWGLDIFRTWRF